MRLATVNKLKSLMFLAVGAAAVNACAVEQRLLDADHPRSGLAPGAAAPRCQLHGRKLMALMSPSAATIAAISV